jgi:hypothetical protein
MHFRIGYILIACFGVLTLRCFAQDGEIFNEINEDLQENEKIRPNVSDKYCSDKFSCQANHTCLCHSDSVCELLNDCCQGSKREEHSNYLPDISKYSCKKIQGEIVFGALVISACPKNWIDDESRLLCENSKRIKLKLTYMADDGEVFMNTFCAFCNNVLPKKYSTNTLKICEEALNKGDSQNENCSFLFGKTAQRDSLRSCPLRVINKCADGTPTDVSENCTNGDYGVVYDKHGTAYRNVYCGLCNNRLQQDLSCEKDKVDVGRPYAYTILIETEKVENKDDSVQNSTQMTMGTDNDDVLMYITVVALSISIVALLIMLFVYCRFPKLMNVGGKITFCLALSLLIAQSFFLISSETEPVPWLCKTMAVLVHYFYLVTFCWMNIISFDLFITFSHYRLNWEENRFLYFNLYAWLSPFVIVILSLIFNFTESVGTFNPNYGENRCWFNSDDAKSTFFLIPLAIFKSFDIIAFVFTIYHIQTTRKEAAFARKAEACSFFIYIKLSLIMGLTWTFAFLAKYTNSVILLYLFTILNACQGLSLFLCFVLTNTVFKLVRDSLSMRGLSHPSSSNTTKSTRC